jgi:hypothetical protein
MARILVVSRNPAMSMSLAGGVHEVDTCRPLLLDRWTEGTDQADVYILDLGEPGDATAAVDHLRSTGRSEPILLVAGSAGPWASLEAMPPPGCAVLPLPVTRPTLIAALDGLLQAPQRQAGLPQTHEGRPEPPPTSSANPAPLPPAPAHRSDPLDAAVSAPTILPAVVDLTALPDAPPEEALQAAIREPAQNRATGPDQPRVIMESDAHSGSVEPTVAALPPFVPRPRPPLPPVGAPLSPPKSQPATPPAAPAVVRLPPGQPATLATVLTVEAPPRAVPIPSAPPAPAVPRVDHAASPLELVRALATRIDGLLGVPETANAVVLDAVDRTGAAAAALLVPDGEVWRVAAGSGLRTLEMRCELASDTWLVQMVARASKGMLVEGSDIVRVKMSGAPLASWPHLAAAPVPTVGAILLAARTDRGFSEADLVALASLGQEAEGPLTDALAVRALARGLDEHRNPRDQEGAR